MESERGFVPEEYVGSDERESAARRDGVGRIEPHFTRSSGRGGQNVNKRSTRVQLFVEITDPDLLASLRTVEGVQFTKDGRLIVKAEGRRRQRQNRKAAEAKLDELLAEARREEKQRLPTQPKRSAEERRIAEKRHRGEIKELRKPPREW